MKKLLSRTGLAILTTPNTTVLCTMLCFPQAQTHNKGTLGAYFTPFPQLTPFSKPFSFPLSPERTNTHTDTAYQHTLPPIKKTKKIPQRSQPTNFPSPSLLSYTTTTTNPLPLPSHRPPKKKKRKCPPPPQHHHPHPPASTSPPLPPPSSAPASSSPASPLSHVSGTTVDAPATATILKQRHYRL